MQACNVYGCGELSDSVSVLASDVPDQIEPVVTSITGTDVIIDWNTPSDNFATILEYAIIFETVVGTYVSDLTNCDGQDPLVTQCTVSMADIITLTGLAQG